MSQTPRANPSTLDWYGAHSTTVTFVLATLAVGTLLFVNVGLPVTAAILYALAFVVAGPLLATEARTVCAWLFG